MKTTFCHATTSDELRLTGLLFKPNAETKTGILHLHGRAGNFYANTFLDAMIEEYTKAGFAFLSVNTRGHDHIADFRVGRTEESKRIGQAFDTFADCLLDIGAWLDFLKKAGYERIILQGHSHGAAKAVYFLANKPRPEIVALVLASPADAAGLLKKTNRQFFDRDLSEASGLVGQGRGRQLLGNKIRDWYYVSAKSFVDEFGQNSVANIFSIFDKGAFKEVAGIKVPVLALYGSRENTVIFSPQEDLKIIGSHFTNPKSKKLIFDGADHTYLGHESEIALFIAGWVKEVV
jgi:pimeloyl-ACP methyl ester carboxylesterase